MKRKWSADESWLDLKKRKVRMGRYLVQKHSILLSDRLLSKVFSWAGHVARMSLDKWTLRFTLWSGCCWKQDGKHNPAWNNYDVQHRYALTGTRNRKEFFWEHIIFDFFDKKNKIWWVEAQNKENWRRWAPEFNFFTLWRFGMMILLVLLHKTYCKLILGSAGMNLMPSI